MPVAIREGGDASSLRGFLDLPARVYAGDRNAPAVDRDKQARHIAQLATTGAQRLFVAERDGVTVARLLARKSPLHRHAHGSEQGLIGYFEALDDEGATRALFAAAEEFLRQQSCRSIIGPMDGDTWHRYRVNVGPFDTPPFLLEPWNPPYYERLWRAAGFSELERYSSKRIGDIAPLLPKLKGKLDAAIAAGYRFEAMDRRAMCRELERVYALSLEIFRDNFMYSQISRDEFLAMYDGAERLLEDDSSWFCVAPDGRDAGFIFAYPDRYAAVQLARRGVFGKLRALLHWNNVTAVNHKTLGVLPAHRRSGTGGALLYCAYDAALQRGWRIANHCLMRDDNPSQKMDAGEGHVFRRYVLYTKELA